MKLIVFRLITAAAALLQLASCVNAEGVRPDMSASNNGRPGPALPTDATNMRYMSNGEDRETMRQRQVAKACREEALKATGEERERYLQMAEQIEDHLARKVR